MPKSRFLWGEFRATYVLLGYLSRAQIQDLVDRWPEWPGLTLRVVTQYQPDGRMVLLQQDAEGHRTARFAKLRKPASAESSGPSSANDRDRGVQPPEA